MTDQERLEALKTAVRRLLGCVDVTGKPHYNVRVRDIVTVAQALEKLRELVEDKPIG